MKIWLADLLWLSLVVLATLQLPRIWRGLPAFDAVPGWWLWGEQLWFGNRRAMPLAIALGWVTLGMLYFPTVGKSPAESLSSVEFVIVGVLALTLFVIGALMVTVVLLNRPAFAVPPRWRDEPGALEKWLHARGRRVARPRH